jgi:ribosomal protein S18 acetylase RimI-like enzyme
MIIRPFRSTDADDLIRIATVSFADEYRARGETAEGFARQIRMVTRGRMIPFTILTTLAGYKWKIFVAEINGNVVGCGAYLGREHMILANLMVEPGYRRQGIGQALLETRLTHLARQGYPFVTTTILADNHASLGNVAKQGFEVFDRYTILETSLPLASSDIKSESLRARSLRSNDESKFKVLETQVMSPTWQQIKGSSFQNYQLTLGEQLINRFTGTQHWSRIFTKDDEAIGFLTGTTTASQDAGTLTRPLINDDNLDQLPQMLHAAADWLTPLRKTRMRLVVPEKRTQILIKLTQQGWTQSQSWIQLVKWLPQTIDQPT